MKIIQLKDKDVALLRQKLLDKCNGLCPICEKAVTDPCLDHHHVKKIGGTGQIRGVLCRTCNSFIAKSENNCKRYKIDPRDLPRVLRNCADYLAKEPLPYLHPSEAPKTPKLKKSSYNKLKKAYSGVAKFPVYRVGKGNKRVQTLTKPLEKFFKQYGIEPEFY